MIIGLCGPIGAGKTTVAKYLVEEHDFDRVPFAKVLKDMSRHLLSEEQINGHLKEVPCDELDGRSPREWMQELGTDLGRNRFGKDIWVKAWMRNVKERQRVFKRIVADDVRFPNEVDAIRDLGGKVVLVDRGIGFSGNHASEQWSTLLWDGQIKNVGSITELYNAIEDMLFAHAAD